MKRFIVSGIFMMLMASALYASDVTNKPVYYRKGLFLAADFCPGGLVFNERNVERQRNSFYGSDVAVGYRFAPQLVIALGTGANAYSNRTVTCNGTVPRDVENICVPIFVRLRSDYMDRGASPYMQMDLGYTFMDIYAREDRGDVRLSDHAFPNGRYEYVNIDDNYIQYGNAGFFASLDLGVSLWVIGPLRMNFALSGGVHQAFFGTSFQSDGKIMNFGRIDYLPPMDGESPVPVRTVGRSAFRETLEPFMRVKISFSF